MPKKQSCGSQTQMTEINPLWSWRRMGTWGLRLNEEDKDKWNERERDCFEYRWLILSIPSLSLSPSLNFPLFLFLYLFSSISFLSFSSSFFLSLSLPLSLSLFLSLSYLSPVLLYIFVGTSLSAFRMMNCVSRKRFARWETLMMMMIGSALYQPSCWGKQELRVASSRFWISLIQSFVSSKKIIYIKVTIKNTY